MPTLIERSEMWLDPGRVEADAPIFDALCDRFADLARPCIAEYLTRQAASLGADVWNNLGDVLLQDILADMDVSVDSEELRRASEETLQSLKQNLGKDIELDERTVDTAAKNLAHAFIRSWVDALAQVADLDRELRLTPSMVPEEAALWPDINRSVASFPIESEKLSYLLHGLGKILADETTQRIKLPMQLYLDPIRLRGRSIGGYLLGYEHRFRHYRKQKQQPSISDDIMQSVIRTFAPVVTEVVLDAWKSGLRVHAYEAGSPQRAPLAFAKDRRRISGVDEASYEEMVAVLNGKGLRVDHHIRGFGKSSLVAIIQDADSRIMALCEAPGVAVCELEIDERKQVRFIAGDPECRTTTQMKLDGSVIYEAFQSSVREQLVRDSGN